MSRHYFVAAIVTLSLAARTDATEPNETFETATVLSPGVLSVSDELTLGTVQFPDTLLGIRDSFGQVYHVDDDGSPVGSGTASGAGGLDTNSGSIQFAVTGIGDNDFDGTHSEAGHYEVFVEVYDLFDDPVDSFSELRSLEPGIVHEFSYSDSEWINGSYDVYIDNTVGPPTGSDVDFFTFTGLNSGMEFTARTLNPGETGVDTLLGWFDDSGMLLDANDDDGVSQLSLIQGIVPNGGTLSFAVTGSGDSNFVGSHDVEGMYELQVAMNAVQLAGDYNSDSSVDAADYVLWRKTLGQMGAGLAADGNNNNRIDDGDYVVWRSHFGNTVANSATLAPEPTAFGLQWVGTASLLPLFCRRRYKVRRSSAIFPIHTFAVGARAA